MRNNVDLGIAFENLSPPLYPYAELDQGAKITLID